MVLKLRVTQYASELGSDAPGIGQNTPTIDSSNRIIEDFLPYSCRLATFWQQNIKTLFLAFFGWIPPRLQ